MSSTYYAIVTFGIPSTGRRSGYYRSQERAVADAKGLRGGSCTSVRVVRCPSRRNAQQASISDSYPVVWSR